jgi:broad specificity phosphatase PhoE
MLYLIRHGETDWNREPARCQGWAEVGLNDTGRRQARGLAAKLRDDGLGIELIVSSHLTRARETAEIVRAELLGERPPEALPLAVDERLAETRRGRWETRAFAAIMAEEPDEWRAYREHPETFRFPEGESLAEQQRRVLEGVRDAARTGRVALLVTHGGSIRLVRCFLDGRGIEAFHDESPPNGGVYTIDAPDVAARIDAFLGLAAPPRPPDGGGAGLG